MDKLDLFEEPVIDDSLAYEKYIDCVPNTIGQLNNSSIISISTTNKDSIVQLDESYFVIDIDLTKSDGSRFADKDKIGVPNNFVMFLFSEAKLSFDNQEIEKILDLGRNTLCNGCLNYSTKFGLGEGYSQGWYHYSSNTFDNMGYKTMSNEILTGSLTNKGKFRFNVPFNHIFGFKGKALLGMIYKVEFARLLGNDGIYRESPAATATSDANVAKIVIDSIKWSVPTYELNETAKTMLYDRILKEPMIKIPINTRYIFNTDVSASTQFVWNITQCSSHERIYGVVLFFQTGRLNTDQFTSPAVFDHCNLQTAKVSVNDNDYPGIHLANSFEELGYLDWYKMFIHFRKNVLGHNEDSGIIPSTFKNVYPFFVFDLSKQKTNITGNNYTITMQCTFASNPASQTRAYAMLLTNKLLQFQLYKNHTMKFISNF